MRRLAAPFPWTATIVAASIFSGCTSTSQYFDYRPYQQHMPRSILVLPPIDKTLELEATSGCLSVVTRPLAERGYYVFPVAVVDAMMKENGLPTPVEMHQVSLKKIAEIFGADAVLYLEVKEWGMSFKSFRPDSPVTIVGRLVDVKTGTELWHGTRSVSSDAQGQNQDPNSSLGEVLERLTGKSTWDTSRNFARTASFQMIDDPNVGMLEGPYSPKYQTSRRR